MSTHKNNIFAYWDYFRWILNAFFIAFPIELLATVCTGLNIYTSIDMNKWWANGNLFLIGKTIYVLSQGLLLLPLIFEIDVWLRHAKDLRMFSLMCATIFMVMWLSVFGFWYLEIYYPPSWMKYDVIDLFVNLFFAYNVIFDSLAVPASFAIIVKELSLEFFQFLKKDTQAEEDNLSLNLIDIADTWISIGFILNPLNIFVFFWKFLTGKIDTTDIEGEEE